MDGGFPPRLAREAARVAGGLALDGPRRELVHQRRVALEEKTIAFSDCVINKRLLASGDYFVRSSVEIDSLLAPIAPRSILFLPFKKL